MKDLAIEEFKRVTSVTFKGEHYLVRDNGAICRLPKSGSPKRPLDDRWTLGTQCPVTGYRKASGVVVHQIVATAFHGPRPTLGHVVDHIDTNRGNNQLENLRWVTRLENILLNKKTLRRIESKWGSIGSMLEDPMRKEKTNPIGDRTWMPPRDQPTLQHGAEVQSLTEMALQRNWKTPSAFPSCPKTVSSDPLGIYLERLHCGAMFSRNKFGLSVVVTAAASEDRALLSVLTKKDEGFKPWGIATVTFENERFIHTACGTFFTLDGAEKCHVQLIGGKWNLGETFDDFC